MFRKTLLLVFLSVIVFNGAIVSAENDKMVELFDIEKNERIDTTPTNSNVQLEAEKIIKAIDDVYKKFKPIPDKGYIIKIPLEPPYQLENQWIHAVIDEVVILIPEEGEPYLLLFDDENTPCFFTINTKIASLLEILDFSL
ncbi:hypothetical protein [Bacillus sp. B15-48]|uniref:hypothetical protein n=1 Tax=Bacillus sp. B15-48 TaxID=1548601 RepID=UPI00193F9DCA|nr:hypothetical protein [Bacillus sp. B15-48]MBM4761127.1 hypothetical protein [Bacillus sp. B15-48]